MSEIKDGVGKFYCEDCCYPLASEFVSVDALKKGQLLIDINDNGDDISLSMESARDLIKFLNKIVDGVEAKG